MNVLGTWTSKGLPRPSWSNARGDVSIFIIASNLTRNLLDVASFGTNLA